MDAELAFNYMGGGSWESTRGLKLGARDGFHAWVIVGSIAPRGLIYSHEFAWDDKRDPVWTRFNRIWGDFYGAADKLSFAKGSGSVTGKPPESTHCNNIGAIHRKPMYPTLNKWFGLPIPEENKKRFDSSELQCWTDEARQTLKPMLVHQYLKVRKEPAPMAKLIPKLKNPKTIEELDALEREDYLEALGISPKSEAGQMLRTQKNALITTEQVPFDPPVEGPTFVAQRIIVRQPMGNLSLAVPMLILRPKGTPIVSNVVIGLAQDGKAGFLKQRAELIAELLKNKIAVCLPDLRGTGETASDGRGRTSGATSYSASLLLHGRTVPGVQLEELAAVMSALPKLGYKSIALWGDSFAEPNDPKSNFAVPHDAGKMPRQSEPMGGLMALLGGVFSGPNVKAIYVRGGLVSFASLLDSPFCYYPHDAVIPGILRTVELDRFAHLNNKRGLRMESLVDGLNRRVDQKTLTQAYQGARFTRPAHDLMVLREEPGTPGEVAAWLVAKFKK